MAEGFKDKVARGTFWVFLEQLCTQGLNFGMGVVLARLLTPNDYGTVALVTIFTAIGTVLVNSGFGQALVQKKDADDLDFSSVFYVSMALSLVLYGVLFLIAPFVAAYYRVAELTAILRILSLNLILFACSSAQNAELFREMRFNVSFRISLISTLTSAVVGISMAFSGYGVWALVFSSVLSNLVGVIVRWYFIAWRPGLIFSWRRVAQLFQFGWKLMVSALIGSTLSNLYGIIIGRCYSRADLAFVNKGQNIPELLKNNIQTSIVEAAFPAVAQLQDDRTRLLRALRRLSIASAFIVLPLMTFVGLTSRNTILFLYGEKWVGCVPYAQFACVSAGFMIVAAVNELALTALGRSDLFLKINLARMVGSILLLGVCLRCGVWAWMAAEAFVYAPLAVVLDVAVCRRQISGWGFRMQGRDLLPILALTSVLGGGLAISNCISVGTTPLSLFICLAGQGLVFFTSYLVLAVVFRMKAARDALDMFAPRLLPCIPALKRVMDYVGAEGVK